MLKQLIAFVTLLLLQETEASWFSSWKKDTTCTESGCNGDTGCGAVLKDALRSYSYNPGAAYALYKSTCPNTLNCCECRIGLQGLLDRQPRFAYSRRLEDRNEESARRLGIEEDRLPDVWNLPVGAFFIDVCGDCVGLSTVEVCGASEESKAPWLGLGLCGEQAPICSNAGDYYCVTCPPRLVGLVGRKLVYSKVPMGICSGLDFSWSFVNDCSQPVEGFSTTQGFSCIASNQLGECNAFGECEELPDM